MPLHTPQSIWEKYKRPTLEVTPDGYGVSLGADSYLVIRWSAGLPPEQVLRWLAFFAKCMSGPEGFEGTTGITLDGESSTVVSLAELKAGLALLSKLTLQSD